MPLSTVSQLNSRLNAPRRGQLFTPLQRIGLVSLTSSFTVKFEGTKLPAILDSLDADNNGQKLVLEVAVRLLLPENFST